MKYASIEEIMTSSSYRTYYLNCPHITHYSIDQKLAYLIVIKYFIVIKLEVLVVSCMTISQGGGVCGPAGRHCHGNKGVSAGAGWAGAH